MSKKQPVISFYYPATNIGGAQLLFARVAKELWKDGYSIKIYQHEKCYISNFLENNKVIFEEFTSSQKFSVTENEVFILSMSYASRIVQRFNFSPNNRFIFWDLNHYCLLEQTSFSFFYKKIKSNKIKGSLIKILEKARKNKINTFLREGNKKNGVFFMSGYDYLFNSEIFNFDIMPNYLPIPLSVPSITSTKTNEINPIIRIGWISRLVRGKNKILILLMDDIKKSNHNIHLVIVGEGNDVPFLKDYAKKIDLLSVTFAGRIDNETLPDFLTNNIDIGFSVGTSALEFSRQQIPTVLMPNKTDAVYFRSNIYRYNWLHEMTNYDVSTYRSAAEKCKDFSSILADYSTNNNQGKMSYKYVKKHHDISNISEIIQNFVTKNTYTFSSLKETGITQTSLGENYIQKIKLCLRRK